MSQNSTVVANGTGAAVRAAINNALDSLRNCFSGASAPSSPEEGWLWEDTTNHVLKRYNGSEWVIIWDASMAVSGQSVLGSSFSITADATWQDTGLSISLPAAGTYIIGGNAMGYARVSATPGASVSGKLYNSTDGADVANSERVCGVATVINADFLGTGAWFLPLTVAAAKTIKLYAFRSVATWSFSQIQSNTTGRTTLSYLRIL